MRDYMMEAGVTLSWERHAGCRGTMIEIDRLGASAKRPELMTRIGITPPRVVEEALDVLGKEQP